VLADSHLLDPGDGRAVTAWNPAAPPPGPHKDARYFGRVIEAAERRLDGERLTWILTWNVASLPLTGPRVVAIVLGDEAARRPAYADDVLAVFKAYGARPRLRAADLRRPPGLAWAVALQHARRRAEALRDRRGTRPVHRIPLGTFNQVELPLVPIEQRPVAVSFAGSVEDVPRLVPIAKAVSRRAMLAGLDAFRARRPAARLSVRVTPRFGAPEAEDAVAYSRSLMDAKICLAPRGGSVETFRFFEGLRAGCVVVGEPMPRTWFYDGSPMVEVRDWLRLPAVLERLLDDPTELRRRHAAALAWWRERCSEEAVGAFVAERVRAALGA
jgi:hypothetical protein